MFQVRSVMCYLGLFGLDFCYLFHFFKVKCLHKRVILDYLDWIFVIYFTFLK